MFEVAKNPTIQHKLSVEIEDMFERTEGSPEYADIAQMTYLEACLNGNLQNVSLWLAHLTDIKFINLQKRCENIHPSRIWYATVRRTSK